jgi:integrase
MRRRFQNGSLIKKRGKGKVWEGQWTEDGHKRKRVLGLRSQMTKSEALRELAKIVAPLNNREAPPSKAWTLADFMASVFLPFYRRKWKRSTAMTNEDRMEHHLVSEFGSCTLGSFNREQLQDVLDRKAAAGLSFGLVDHLRWDLKQVFDMAVAEGFLLRNPAQLLFTPRECPRPATKIMTAEEVRKLFGVLNVREQLIARLAVLAGMRPGEIFALKWQRLEAQYADIQQRVYRGDIDSPKIHVFRPLGGALRWPAFGHSGVASCGC